MNCRQCGQPLPEGIAFCSVCGAKQDAEAQPSVQPQMYYEVKVKQKKKKNPIVPVILNLIALLLLFSMNLNAAFKDQPDNFIGISVYLLFIPLLMSIGVLLLKDSKVKLIISIIELVSSIIIALTVAGSCESVGLLFLLLIFEIIVSSYELSYARNIKNNYQVVANSKFGKILGIISAVVAVPIIILTITTVVPYQQYKNILDSIKEVNIEEMSGMLAKIDNFEKHHSKYADKIDGLVDERIKLLIKNVSYENMSEMLAKIDDLKKNYPKYADEINETIHDKLSTDFYKGYYTGIIKYLETLGKTQQANKLTVWSNFKSIVQQNRKAAETSLIGRLKDPGSYMYYDSTFNYLITKYSNAENEVIVEGSVKLDYSAKNSFGATIRDRYWFECPKRILGTLGFSEEEVKEIVDLDNYEMLDIILDSCLQ